MPPKKQRTAALRSRIGAEALSLLERSGPLGFRARAVANAADTSTAALYELFGDKAGLIQSLYEDGFTELITALVALDLTDDPVNDVRALFEEIRSFGRKRPRLFEVMFSRPFEEFTPDAQSSEGSESLVNLVVERVTRWLRHEDSSADPVDVARVLLSANRGLVADENVGFLGSTPMSRTRRWNLTFDALLSGIAGQRSAETSS